ncbi:lipopolysaccharide biosynthesis protein [Novosphingobium barchaimii LL02]|uniref:Lipopolysaccharide biosynthesis protein n=1 Tax=Novosphingobium barchaimii LL02 TaxID=1114963 RepID=A0A0J7XXJ6_9SPHN|nr:Wzz/FepE/Etk N-terminal domain-containing protein [Novosphingobium barchaimii]KMS56396.1 lipopolysaccharide biosynthesis protein [Novosphingobium barchaimii LL02]
MTDEQAPNLSVISPLEIFAIFFRRRWWIVVPAVIGTVAALAAALLMTPAYRSQATLLIDAPEIPTGFAPPVQSANYANESVAKIREQIMSRSSLTRLIREAGLYKREQNEMSFEDLLGVMRNSIAVDLVSANGRQPSGNGNDTIAFDLSFTYSDPVAAHKVAERLVAMFLTEDKRLRTEKAVSTASFLTRRVDDLRAQMVELEGKRREVESRYAGALPDQVALSAQSGSSLRAEVSRLDAETQGLMQQNGLLAARSEEIASAPKPEFEALRTAEDRLAQLSATYSDTYPDVVAARAAVSRQRQAALSSMRPSPGSGVVASEMAAARSRISSLAARRGELVGSISQMDRMTAMAPQATYELNNLERDYDNLKRQYQDVRDKQMEAQVTANLQAENKGERFSVVNAASIPGDPIRPKRLQMVAGGLFGGLALGFALVVVWEVLAGPIHGVGAVTRLMNAPPLAVVPVLGSGSTSPLFERISRLLQKRRGRPNSRRAEA